MPPPAWRPHYLGVFLTERSRVSALAIARDARGSEETPPGCKLSGDHVTCVYAPTSRDLAAFPLDALRDNDKTVTFPATTVASGEGEVDAQAFVIGVDFTDAQFLFGLSVAHATPHVSVFVAEHASWSVCGDVLARAVANGTALPLAAIGAERVLEGTLGVMMCDASDASVRWVARSMDEVREAMHVGPYGASVSGVRYVKSSAIDDACADLDETYDSDDTYGSDGYSLDKDGSDVESYDDSDDSDSDDDSHFYDESSPASTSKSASLDVHELFRAASYGSNAQAASQEQEYIELCEMFEGLDTEWIHERYVESGCSKEIAAYMIESTLLSQNLNIIPTKKKPSTPPTKDVDEPSTPAIELGFHCAGMSRGNYGYGHVGVGAYFKSDGPAIRGRPYVEHAVRQWTSLQGDRASAMLAARRAANILVKQEWVDDLNEDMEKLRLLRKKGGDAELEKRIRDKLGKRVALERMAMSKAMPRFDDDTEFNVVIDFHGYSRVDAVRELEREMVRVSPLVTSNWTMKLITGRGIHSKGGPVVYKTIKAWLDQFGLAYEENQDAGHIVVRATAPVYGTKMRRD